MYCQFTPFGGDQQFLNHLCPWQDQAWNCRAASAGQGQGESCGASVLHASILGPNKALVPSCKSIFFGNPSRPFIHSSLYIFKKMVTSHPLKVVTPGQFYPEDPPFLHEMNGELAEIEPPVYSEQGQQRGRKPQKSSKKSKKGARKGKGKSKRGTKDNKKARTKGTGKKLEKIAKAAKKARKAEAATESPGEKVENNGVEPIEDECAPSGASGSRPKRRRDPSKSPHDDVELEFTIPEDCVAAPEGIKSNLVYSKAYVIKKNLGLDTDECRLAGRHASWLLREKNLVSPSLSGPPIYTPKPRKAKDAKEHESENLDTSEVSVKPRKTSKKKKVSIDGDKKGDTIEIDGEGGNSSGMAVESWVQSWAWGIYILGDWALMWVYSCFTTRAKVW